MHELSAQLTQALERQPEQGVERGRDVDQVEGGREDQDVEVVVRVGNDAREGNLDKRKT